MKIFHFQLQDSLGNKKTLICRLTDGSIRYVLYGGWGSSGISFSLDNISMRYRGNYLPVQNEEGETKEEFTARVWQMLEDSSSKPVHSVNVNVEFA
jgi:NADPH:quinone reductase-like Zn-dependent oxidoreductase